MKKRDNSPFSTWRLVKALFWSFLLATAGAAFIVCLVWLGTRK